MSKRYSKRWNKFPLFSFSIMSMVTLGSLIHPLPPEQKKAIRDLEKVSMKLCKSECSVLFNSLCVKEKLLPNYSNIYIFRYICCNRVRPVDGYEQCSLPSGLMRPVDGYELKHQQEIQ